MVHSLVEQASTADNPGHTACLQTTRHTHLLLPGAGSSDIIRADGRCLISIWTNPEHQLLWGLCCQDSSALSLYLRVGAVIQEGCVTLCLLAALPTARRLRRRNAVFQFLLCSRQLVVLLCCLLPHTILIFDLLLSVDLLLLLVMLICCCAACCTLGLAASGVVNKVKPYEFLETWCMEKG